MVSRCWRRPRPRPCSFSAECCQVTGWPALGCGWASHATEVAGKALCQLAAATEWPLPPLSGRDLQMPQREERPLQGGTTHVETWQQQFGAASVAQIMRSLGLQALPRSCLIWGCKHCPDDAVCICVLWGLHRLPATR